LCSHFVAVPCTAICYREHSAAWGRTAVRRSPAAP
jgi:hypothetical protein